MHEVLISYSTKDKKWADATCSVLESRGIRCWIAPRDIVPGTEWGAAIIGGIDACRVMVLIFSSAANASPQVRREVERAISKGLTIVPCRIEDVKPEGSLEYALGNTHWLDVFTPPVEDQLNRLANSVEALLPEDSAITRTATRLPVMPALPGARPNRRLIAAIGAALLMVVAVSVAIVVWPRKKAAQAAPIAAAAAAHSLGGGPGSSVPSTQIAGSIAPRTMKVERPVSSPAPAPTKPDDHDGFVPLFNGQDLSGWVVEHQPANPAPPPPPPRGKKPPGRKGHPAKLPRWRVEDGAIVAQGDTGANRNYLLTEREYSNFILRLEFRLKDDTISGVAIRAILHEDLVARGHRILDHPVLKLRGTPNRDAAQHEETGTLRWIMPNPMTQPDRQAAQEPSNSWNRLELEVRGPNMRASVNGTEILRVTCPAGVLFSSGLVPGLGRTSGRIGLQKHTGKARFRNIEIKELPPS